MISTILFDLDDTLLVNSMDTFIPQYLKALTVKIDHLIPSDQFVPLLMASTRVMMTNTDPARTNQDVFMDHFFRQIAYTPEELLPLFDEFYAEDYGHLRHLACRKPEARRVVQMAFDRGYQVVIATNPVFPATAVWQRLEWAGVADFDYALVTSYETMHFCKPYPQYFTEILAKVGRQASECLMVGDDPEGDIKPAKGVGMQTFLVDDHSHAQRDYADYRGDLTDVARLLQSWPEPTR